jgi:hypothetical protein
MIALRQTLAGCCLACLLLAGVAGPAAGADQAEPPPAPLDLLELLAKWLGLSDQPEEKDAAPDPQYQMESWSQETVAPEPPPDGKAPDPRYSSRLWRIEPAASGQSQFWRMPLGASDHLGPWGLRRSLPDLLSRSGSASKSPGPRLDPAPDFRPSQFHPGEVTADFGRPADELGIEDSVRMDSTERVRIDIRDLLRNDLGWQCEGACDLKNTDKLDLRDFAADRNIKLILQKGKFIYIEADERRQKSIFTYEVFDRATGATADVRVNVWFGNRLPQTKRDKLVGFADAENAFDISDLLGNDRDRDGDLLDLVRVWCPENGRVFMREVDGELKIFFQPDEGFTGVAYFKYTIADLSDPDDAGDPSRERKTFAEGIVRVRVLASPS